MAAFSSALIDCAFILNTQNNNGTIKSKTFLIIDVVLILEYIIELGD
jgi:hypothetical protein